jgi:hypothetical protein
MKKELPVSTLIKPRDTIMVLHGKKYKINKYSLAIEFAITDKYGDEQIKQAFLTGTLNEKMRIVTDIIYMLIDDKTDFPTYEKFLLDIAGLEDKAIVLTACNIAMGATIPAITPDEAQELEDEKKNARKPKAKTLWNQVQGFFTGAKK